MRTIVVIALILVCASMAGWFSINREDGETTIRINRDEIRQDARAAIDRGKNYLDRKDGEQFASQQQGQLQPPQNWQGQQQYQQQGGQQQYTQQQYTQQQYGQQQYPPQQQYQQPAAQQPNQGFYFPETQHANRPPAPWNQNQQPQAPRQQY